MSKDLNSPDIQSFRIFDGKTNVITFERARINRNPRPLINQKKSTSRIFGIPKEVRNAIREEARGKKKTSASFFEDVPERIFPLPPLGAVIAVISPHYNYANILAIN